MYLLKGEFLAEVVSEQRRFRDSTALANEVSPRAHGNRGVPIACGTIPYNLVASLSLGGIEPLQQNTEPKSDPKLSS